MKLESNTMGEIENKSGKRNLTIKILVDADEDLFIRGKFNNYNNTSVGSFIQKRKSLSEFLREIILKSLLNFDREQEINGVKINNLEKFTRRNLSLTYKMMEKNYGEEEAKKILLDIKKSEKENKNN